LHATEDLLARYRTAPVINHPSRVLATGRAALGALLRDMPGIIVPRIVSLPRAELLAESGADAVSDRGFSFPVLLRAPGFHSGRHFLRVETASDLASAASRLPCGEVLAIEYLQGGWADGCARKGRVMFIDGRLYPLHWAISRDWKVHYFTADMADRPTARAREARFLADMPGVLGGAAMATLADIAATLGLDYAGIDFALAPDGRILLFEANAAMVIADPMPGPLGEYRRPAVERARHPTRRLGGCHG
jgi:hypothetical protein